jgi:pimeloyl-ACP methyl ester carboxylesterase
LGANAEARVNAPATAVAPATEEAFFFPVGASQVFAMLHRPSRAPSLGVVMCHALAEEKLWSHRVYVSFARQLANAGVAVLRFDMRGEGDSDLEFEDSTLETRIADTEAVVTALRAKLGAECRVILLGHRFGGSIAAAVAARLADRLQGLAIWDPLPDTADYFQQLLRSNLTTQMAIHGKVIRTREVLIDDLLAGQTIVADGYGLQRNFYQQAVALDWSNNADVFARPVLLLEVAKAGQVEPSPRLKTLGDTYSTCTCQVVVEPPLWRETRQFHQAAKQFSAQTMAWLSSQWPEAVAT